MTKETKTKATRKRTPVATINGATAVEFKDIEKLPKPRKRATGKHPALAAPYGRAVYKAPGAPAGFLSTMLGTVSRDTLMVASDTCNADLSFAERYKIGLMSGSTLGLVGMKYDPASRQQKPFILR